MNYNKIYKNK